MKPMALLALSGALLCGGCVGIDVGGYYGHGPSAYQMQHVKEGAILCHLPAKDRWHEAYVLTNTRQACLEVGGVPLPKT
jgi:hypothetical protein